MGVGRQCLHLVEEPIESGHVLGETLALPREGDDACRLAARLERVAGELLPVIKHALGERLAAGVRTQVSREACNTQIVRDEPTRTTLLVKYLTT